MKANQTIFSCSNCGAQFPKWQGRCLDCGKWGTLVEELAPTKAENQNAIKLPTEKTVKLSEISTENEKRQSTGISELDRVLGGGLVPGSFILFGGDPGIGKSTIALQMAGNLGDCLYVSGEESASQVKLRAQRLNVKLEKINFLSQTDIDKIIATASNLKPKILIIDSIQTVTTNDATGTAGNVSQITACASKLMGLAKSQNISVAIIGHVTKDGNVAGPKTLEHLVDTVVYLENDSQNFYKIMRSVKNRFGSVGEIGVFEMTAEGLKEISDPSGIFMDKQIDLSKPGSCSTMIIEGSRPFLIEIQALTAKTFFGYPQRKSSGYDLNRLQMILAVVTKYAKANLGSHDVYLNIAGGLKAKDTSADLASAIAVLSAYAEKPPTKKLLALGEIGLSGEIRSVPQLERRIKEAVRLGFNEIVIPASQKITPITGAKIIALSDVSGIGQLFKI